MNPTTPEARKASSRTGLIPYRLNVRQYLRMIEMGILPSGARVELLGGLLVRKMTKSDAHDYAVSQLGHALASLLAPEWVVREEKSVALDDRSRPEPDLIVARGPRTRYAKAAPGPEDIALVVEVADSSYRDDRGVKLRRYASAKIPAYWIVDLTRSRVEVHADPEAEGRSAVYRTIRIHDSDARVPATIMCMEFGHVDIGDFLPRNRPED